MRIPTMWMALTIGGAMVAATGCSNLVAPANSASTTTPDPKERTKQLLATDPQLAASVEVSENADWTQLILSGIVPTEQLRNKAINMAKQAGPNAVVIDRIEIRSAVVAEKNRERETGR